VLGILTVLDPVKRFRYAGRHQTRIVDLEPGREIISHHDVPVFRPGLGDLQHYREAVVLLGFRRVRRLAIEREIIPFDLEAIRAAAPA